MLGLALEAFHKEQKGEIKEYSWPHLNTLRKLGRLSEIDISFAYHFLEVPSSKNEGLAAFLCHLLQMAREGHLCIQIEDFRLNPCPLSTWLAPLNREEEEQITFPLDIRALHQALISASQNIPEHWLCVKDREDFHLNQLSLKPFYQVGPLLYFQRNWIYETLFLTHWARLNASFPSFSLQEDCLESSLAESVEKHCLLPEQAEAIRRACRHSLSVISGGPGTGKTYTAGYLIRLLLEASAGKPMEIALAAPTGKAAAALQASISRAIGSQEKLQFHTTTLHRLLGTRAFSHDLRRSQFLTADLLLIDESSMIDAKLMALLFSGVKNGARLILLGDKNQLPPVEMGGLFRDLTEQEQAKASTSLLSTCMRAESKTLQDLAQAINEGNYTETLRCMHEGGEQVKAYAQLEKIGILELQRLVESALPHPSALDDQGVMSAFQHFRLLSPTRKGPFGIETLNSLLYQRFSEQRAHSDWMACPIIVTRNDARLELCNGDVGVLVRKRRNALDNFHSLETLREGDYGLFGDPLNPKRVPAVLLPPFEAAFCLSIHKSQGSEFDQVALLLPEGAEAFGRELLYTAVTRARKKIEIFYNEIVLKQALIRTSHRLSGVSYRMPCSSNTISLKPRIEDLL